jgi:hypothetical protein
MFSRCMKISSNFASNFGKKRTTHSSISCENVSLLDRQMIESSRTDTVEKLHLLHVSTLIKKKRKFS